MNPSLHYKVTKYIVVGVWCIGLICCQLNGWIWSDDAVNVTPIILLFLCSVALDFLGKKIPARCPGCGERRAHVFRDRTSDDKIAIHYKCESCGQVEDTGIVETISEI